MSLSIIYNMQYSLIRIGAPAMRVPTGIATYISGRAD
jgi:hypothetical protein